MASVIYSLSTKTDKGAGKALSLARILLRFSGSRDNVYRVKTSFHINPKRWNPKKNQIIIPDLETAEKRELTKLKGQLDDLSNKIKIAYTEADKSTITKQWLEDFVDRYHFPEKYAALEETKPITLFGFIADFIEKAPQRKDRATGRLLSHNNIQQYKATEKHLHAYAERISKDDFEFEEINQQFYDGFVEYLQSEMSTTDEEGKKVILKASFTANSVGKHIRILKLMLNEATNEKVNTSVDYNRFHVFTEDTDTVYLNEAELQKIKDVDLSKSPYLDRTRDWFLLLSWTGCRFSDLEKIGKTDIKDGFITFRQQKTNAKVTIPLHPVVLEILNKYEFDLPEAISNQRFNEYIKEVANKAGIDTPESITRTVGGSLKSETFPKHQLISSHTGRRSFCTNMYKRGLPTLMIMSISGHKTEKSFLKYIKVTQAEHASMMKKAWADMYSKKEDKQYGGQNSNSRTVS